MSKPRRKPAPPPLPQGLMPTKHTLDHGEYRVARIERNGAKVAVNYTENPLRTMEHHGSITSQQREAGETVEALHRMVWGGDRSDILSQHVRGLIHETEAMIDRERNAKALLSRIERRIGNQSAFLRMLDVCVYGIYIPKAQAYHHARERLCEALDGTADVLGIPKYRE